MRWIRKSVRSLVPASFLFGVWLIFFSRTLFAGKFYFLDDLKIIFYPLEYVYAQFQHHWQLPQWSPLFGFGQPLLAWGQLGFFTPLHIVLRAFSVHPLILLQISIVTYYAFGLGGMFLFLRRHKISAAAANLGAIVFVFCGFHVGHLNHVNFYTATMWLPWLLLTLDHFITRPTGRLLALTSGCAGVIALSGQPQIVLYTLMAATLYGLVRFFGLLADHTFSQLLWPRLPLLIIAATLFFALASFTILPLQEFLPLTERSDALIENELFEFSYPPYHAITVLLPTFFGNHEIYWGAKNFQELAAYVGFIPLFVTGVALVDWRRQRILRVSAVLMLAVGLLFALGQYSPIYFYLVKTHILTSLSVPGRFVFFIDVALAILAAVGLDDLLAAKNRKQRIIHLLGGLLTPLLILTPFLIYLQTDIKSTARLQEFMAHPFGEWGLLLAGIGVALAGFSFVQLPRWRIWAQWGLVSGAAATLLVFGWNYNPLTDWQVAMTDSPFTEQLKAWGRDNGLPARLYGSDQPILTTIQSSILRRTDTISPLFSVYQPVEALNNDLSCFHILIESDQPGIGSVQIGISSALTEPPLQTLALDARDIPLSGRQRICFNPIPNSAGQHYIVSFTSETQTSIHLLQEAAQEPDGQVYFVRIASPTTEQLNNSRKLLHIIIQQEHGVAVDQETALLMRHLQVIAETSSARWIGALSIKPYREFLEAFLANDREPYDGDGLHVLTRFRNLANLLGITHVTEALPPGVIGNLEHQGWQLEKEDKNSGVTVRLYSNPAAFPKVFMIRDAIFMPGADDVRFAMADPHFNPRDLIYIDAPTPPAHLPAHRANPLLSESKIIRYESTQVDVQTNSPEEAFLVLNETATPQWHTFIDNRPVARIIADTVFRAALVPAGSHIVSFRYSSPAIELAKKLSLAGWLIALLLFLFPAKQFRLFLRRRLGGAHPIP